MMPSPRLLCRRLRHALDNHGPRGLLLRALRRLLRRPEPAAPAGASPDLLHPFDQAHAVDTSGHIHGEQLASQTSLASSDFYNTAYYGISPSTLTAALSHLPTSPAGFSFVDLGCGKGRALLVAAQFPFTHILGIELSPDLCRVALANTISDARITIHHHDATTFSFPETPLVLYLYHPFLAPMLRRFLTHLERQLRPVPREAFLLYATPTYPRVMARFPFLTEVWNLNLALSPEDAAADRHGITHERYILYKAQL